MGGAAVGAAVGGTAVGAVVGATATGAVVGAATGAVVGGAAVGVAAGVHALTTNPINAKQIAIRLNIFSSLEILGSSNLNGNSAICPDARGMPNSLASNGRQLIRRERFPSKSGESGFGDPTQRYIVRF